MIHRYTALIVCGGGAKTGTPECHQRVHLEEEGQVVTVARMSSCVMTPIMQCNVHWNRYRPGDVIIIVVTNMTGYILTIHSVWEVT